MAKETGLGDNFYIGGYNISGDVGSMDSISCPLAVLETTGLDKYAMERLGAHQDGNMAGTSFWNVADNQMHEALSTMARTDVVMSYFHGSTLGNPAASMVAKKITFNPDRGDDGSLTAKFEGQANSYGLDWGKMLTAGVRSDTAATNGTGVDFGTGSTAFGLQAYLQVFSFTGTSVTFTIQESSDNAVGDPFAAVTGGAFTVVTAAPAAERIQTARAQTVERYLRIVTTGTFSQCSFAVMVNRNSATVNY